MKTSSKKSVAQIMIFLFIVINVILQLYFKEAFSVIKVLIPIWFVIYLDAFVIIGFILVGMLCFYWGKDSYERRAILQKTAD
jgi:energy-coupling factor transporter transmembrane protein EcfT